MMISPEGYYEFNLKGKSKTALQKEIQKLRKEIQRLKDILENPNYEFEVHYKPSPETQLQCNRLYLEEAKKAFIEAGGIYKPSRQEKKNQEFINNLEDLKFIRFEYGGYFQGYSVYLVEFNGELATISKYHFNVLISVNEIVKQDLMNSLKSLYIGEWLKEYTTYRFGIEVLDGVQWSLIFEYNQHKKLTFSGDNCFPFNFKDFYSLFEDEEE